MVQWKTIRSSKRGAKAVKGLVSVSRLNTPTGPRHGMLSIGQPIRKYLQVFCKPSASRDEP